MTPFWLIALAMTLAALACATYPLLAAPNARNWRHAALAGALIALMPSAALTLYMRIGDPAALAMQTATSPDHASLEAAITRLYTKLRAAPSDAPGWAMLARSYAVLDRPADAVAAYRRALALTPRDPDLLADYADALASANDGALTGDAQRSIDAALAIAPDHPKALALAASAALDRHDDALAIRYWERLKTASAEDSEIARQAQKNIDETRERADRKGMLEVHVSLNPALKTRVHANDTVFVYALAADGARMPLAVQRLRAAQLPATVTLDDSMSMPTGRRLSDVDTIRVSARVSASGNAQPMPGDLSGTSGPVTRTTQSAQPIEVVIAEIAR